MTPELQRAESLIREIPDYPIDGILFRDITPLLADGPALRATVDALIAPFHDEFDYVVGLEARGFLLASAAAYASCTGLVPIRKAGKLPQPAAAVNYELEYGQAIIEAHDDMPQEARVLIIDDVLATGGTLIAAEELMLQLGYKVVGSAVLFEIDGLGGREAVQRAHRDRKNARSGPLHTVFHS